MDKIPTAEEILDSYSTFDEFGNRIWMLSSVLNAMKESNKLHVKAALQAAADNVYGEGHQLIDGKVVPLEKSDGIIFHPADQPYPDLEFIINPDSILNAYPESNIK